jgi:hypothetical protein
MATETIGRRDEMLADADSAAVHCRDMAGEELAHASSDLMTQV